MSAFEQNAKVRKRVFMKSLICSFAVTAAVFALLPSGGNLTPEKRVEETSAEAVFETPPVRASAPAKANAAKRISEKLSASAYAMRPAQFDFGVGGITLYVPDFPVSSAAFNAVEFSGDTEINFDTDSILPADTLDKVPSLLTRVNIKYPPEMLKRGIEGIVRLSVIIEKDGSASVEKVLESSAEAFEKSALEAARKLKYEVPTKNSVPVRARFVLPIPFTISK